MSTHEQTRAGAVVQRSAEEIWEVLRDFNSYPTYIGAVEESLIEDGLTGTTVGAVRRFRTGVSWTRQRLVALSDVERSFSYESMEPTRDEDHGVERELTWYRGVVRLHPTTVDGECYVDWSVSYSCPTADADHWSEWWAQAVPGWLEDLSACFAVRS